MVHGYRAVSVEVVQSILDDELEPLLQHLERLIPAVEARGAQALGQE